MTDVKTVHIVKFKHSSTIHYLHFLTVIFDPAVFYGHSEYELSIADMFGGFPRSFYNAYHSLLPKEQNFDKRKDLYKLFHCLNHW